MRFLQLAFIYAVSQAGTLFAEEPVKELQLQSIAFVDTKHELSGAAVYKGKLHIVSNGKKDHFVYKLREQDGRLNLKKSIKLKKLDGFKGYLAGLKRQEKRTDFEGLAACDEELFIAEERSRFVLMVGEDSLQPIDFSLKDLPHWLEGDENSGVEGIAVDCEKRILFLAKEKDPSMLVSVSLDSKKVLDMLFDSTLNGPPRIFSDLHFEGGFIYVIETNTWQILKFDVSRKIFVDALQYKNAEADLYDSKDPWSLAEFLVLTKGQIILGLDNNHNPLTMNAQKKYNVNGQVGAILRFERPKNF